jgi:voltage-gated potassium channel Kch
MPAFFADPFSAASGYPVSGLAPAVTCAGGPEEVDVSKVGVGERLRYWFDNTMSRGTPALIAWLGVASLALIGSVTALVVLFAADEDLEGHPPLRLLWESLLRTLDPGTMGADQGGIIFLALMLAVTIGGIFIVSALVGVLNTGLEGKLAELRKGRSRVLEKGHTVILGWSDQIFTIISELAKADDGKRTCVTILADRDKVEMEEEIRTRWGRVRSVKVVCRTGDPTEPLDLEIVRPDEAAAIVIPSPDGDDPDIHLTKTLLALRQRSWREDRPHVAAVVTDSSNLPAAVLAGGSQVHLVDAEDITARLVVQSRRQSGLSIVYTELLNFDGDEMYLRPEPALVGASYGDSLLAYEKAMVLGLRLASGAVLLNPPPQTLIAVDDALILLAETYSAVRLAQQRPTVVETAIDRDVTTAKPPEKTLILGWNKRGPTIVGLLDRYLPAGSVIEIAAKVEADIVRGVGRLEHLKATATVRNPTDRRALEALEPGRFQHVIVLADDGISPHHADSHTLTTLLHLRDIKERGAHAYAIVSELNDEANRRLAQVTKADDFVVSKKLIALLLTQLSKNRHLDDVFAELFDAHGSDIHLKPAAEYLLPDTEANFATVIEAASRRGETAMGYRLQAQAYDAPQFGVVLNPDKREPLRLGATDRVIVLAHH